MGAHDAIDHDIDDIDGHDRPRLATTQQERALALYEANRHWVEPATMTPHERRFFDDLVARVGRGVFLG